MFVVGYPKSGNSWICYLIARSTGAEFDDFDMPGVFPREQHLRDLLESPVAKAAKGSAIGSVQKTHAPASDGRIRKPIVYLVRDGRDVATSYYHYEFAYKPRLSAFESGIPLKMRIHRARWSLRTKFMRPPFSSYMNSKAEEWASHVRDWEARGWDALLRYEDMRAEPVETLMDLFGKLGLDVERTRVADAVDAFDFKKLSGRKAGEGENASFFRKGLVGDWRNQFSDDDAEEFHEIAGDILKRFGYCEDS